MKRYMLKHIYTTWHSNFSKVQIFAKVAIAIAILITTATAQPGALDLSFDPGAGADSSIWATAVQPDGKILIGGEFSSYNGTPVNCLARLHADGTLDTSFHSNPGIEQIAGTYGKIIRTINIQQDGKIIINGHFHIYNGDTSYNVVRLHPDGNRDTTFNVGKKIQSQVRVTCIQPDGKIIAGGNFVAYDGAQAGRIIRLNADGSKDTSFTPGTGASGAIISMALQPDNKILIGGSFGNYDGFSAFRVARLNADGTCDTTFNPGIGGAGSNVDAIAVQPDGRILLGGKFTQYNGVDVGYFLRVYPDGSIDFTFKHDIGANNYIYAIYPQLSGDAIIGGYFTQYEDVNAGRIAQINNDGYMDTTYNPNETGANGPVLDFSSQGNKIITAGGFTTYNGTSRSRIARLYNCLTPQPGSITGDSIVNCSNTTLTFSIAPVQTASRYQWTLPNGWTGSSDSTSITVISNGKPGTVSVKAFSNACGYSYAQKKFVGNSFIPAPSICLVTVDSQSTHNIIIWEKQPTNLIDSFCIYRETTSNTYTKIASVPYDSLSQYHDYDANPNITSYRYKLSKVDTCGVESALSAYHRTIHLQNLANGNFQWTFYQIEGQPNPVVAFNFYRDVVPNGNFFPIGNIPGTNATYTDITYTSFPDADYVVDADWSIACSPSRGPINTTRSNIRKDKSNIELLGINETDVVVLEVFPNPASGYLFLRSSRNMESVNFINALGQSVLKEKISGKDYVVNTSALPSGVYIVAVKTNEGEKKVRVIKR